MLSLRLMPLCILYVYTVCLYGLAKPLNKEMINTICLVYKFSVKLKRSTISQKLFSCSNHLVEFLMLYRKKNSNVKYKFSVVVINPYNYYTAQVKT